MFRTAILILFGYLAIDAALNKLVDYQFEQKRLEQEHGYSEQAREDFSALFDKALADADKRKAEWLKPSQEQRRTLLSLLFNTSPEE